MSPLVLLVTSLYLNPNAMLNDTPVEFTKTFNSIEECHLFKQQIDKDLKKSLEDGLIAYSTICK